MGACDVRRRGVRRGEACQYFPTAGEKSDAEQRLGALGPRLRVRERSLRRREQLDALFQYEVNAGRWVNRRPVYALCFYDLDVFGGDVIVPMVKAHPKVWMTGVLVDNPYHHQPAV